MDKENVNTFPSGNGTFIEAVSSRVAAETKRGLPDIDTAISPCFGNLSTLRGVSRFIFGVIVKEEAEGGYLLVKDGVCKTLKTISYLLSNL